MADQYYQAVFYGVHCEHAHKSFQAAARCAASTIRAAHAAAAGKRAPFYQADEIARSYQLTDAEQCVDIQTRLG